MGVISDEKTSRKRKRSLNKSLTDTDTPKKGTREDGEPESQVEKSAEKRKNKRSRDSSGDSVIEVKKSKHTKDSENDLIVPKKGVDKTKSEEKVTKKTKKSKNQQVSSGEIDETDDITSRNSGAVEEDEKSKGVAVKIKSASAKKLKKKQKKSAFGVVDSKLLAESGGHGNTEEKGKPERPTRINRAVDYLHTWKEDRKSWKFNKNFQSLLVKAIYNPVIIPEDDFETLLLYLGDCKGNARDKLRADAMALIKVEEDHTAEPIDADMEKRAREILQMLG